MLHLNDVHWETEENRTTVSSLFMLVSLQYTGIFIQQLSIVARSFVFIARM